MKFGAFSLLPAQLVVEPSDVEGWESGMEALVFLQRHIPWYLGDAVVYGEAQMGDEFWNSVPFDASLSLLERCASVSRKYPPEDRFPSLSWTHHVVALKVKDPVARRSVLRHAERSDFDCDEFRKFLAESIDG